MKKKGWTKKDWDKYAELRRPYIQALAKAVYGYKSPLIEFISGAARPKKSATVRKSRIVGGGK